MELVSINDNVEDFDDNDGSSNRDDDVTDSDSSNDEDDMTAVTKIKLVFTWL
jgi:hypothetical protein